jgi:DNA-binding NarL/FixJ family response regulator
MKVLLADDSELLRERLAALVREVEDVEVIGETGDIFELLELILRLEPDVVLLDIQMPGGNGIQALEAIKKMPGAPVVIMLAAFSYPQYRKKCLEAGAEFFFDTATEFDLVIGVLKQLQDIFAEGQQHIPEAQKATKPSPYLLKKWWDLSLAKV